MAKCPKCGHNFGIGKPVEMTRCKVCGKEGCVYCNPLLDFGKKYMEASYLDKKTLKLYHLNRYEDHYWSGYCSTDCLVEDILRNPQIAIDYGLENAEKLIDRDTLYTDNNFSIFFSHVLNNLSKEINENVIHILNQYKERKIVQGLIMMINGYKDLDSQKIISGLQLCRRSSEYPKWKYSIDRLAKEWLDDVGSFIKKANVVKTDGIVFQITIPKSQTSTKLLTCPACGAPLNKIVVRGETVKCPHCGSVFVVE